MRPDEPSRMNGTMERGLEEGCSESRTQPVAAGEFCCGSEGEGKETRPRTSDRRRLYHLLDGWVDTPVGLIPRIQPSFQLRDRLQTVAVRIGIGRERYRIESGLYAVGSPDSRSPVLVTANYKLSFDALRRELEDVDAWILVLDTKGVNVWCAAGKGTFSTAEVVRQVRESRLHEVVRHRRLILPQLAATGVCARMVKEACGFRVTWGPVRAADIVTFLRKRMRATPEMRQVRFTFWDRLVLTPVELSNLGRPSLLVLLLIFLISGVGNGVFSVTAAWSRGIQMDLAYFAGVLAGAVAVPLLLPWIPGRAFFLKGGILGALAGVLVVAATWTRLTVWEGLAVVLLATTVSSYLSMNFTGATPYTSPSGVEKEMRSAIPVQALALVSALVVWVGSAFAG